MLVDNTEKKLLEPPQPCPNTECTSSNGFHIWQKGEVIDGYCFVCDRASDDPYGDLAKSNGNIEKAITKTQVAGSPAPSVSQLSVEDGLDHPIRGIVDRGISYATAEHFGVRIGVSPTDGETPVYTLFPRYREGNLVGFKTRTADKHFFSTGGNNVDLFGAENTRSTGKKLYITEGEYDAMSVFQALKENSSIVGYNPSVVSLPSGSSSALKSLTISSELIDGYQELVLVFDSDEPGRKARDIICKSYAGKVSYVTIPHPHKDANDMVMAGKSNDLKWLCLTHSKKYQPDGIVNAKDLWSRYKESDKSVYWAYPDTMPLLNDKTYGVRPGSIVTITSGSGCGKTQFMRELMYHYYQTTTEKIAGMYLEEDISDTLSGLLSLDLEKRISLPDVKVDEEKELESFNNLFGSGRISLYDYFGGMDDSSLLSKLRYFAVTGHKFIFLDHLSIVVSEYAAEGGERERIDTLMTKLAKFVKEFGVVLFLVVHLRKADNAAIPFEQGAIPSLDDLRGSAALKQLSWDVLGLSRNQQHTNSMCANTTEVTVLKCRFTGRTGESDYLYFNEDTGRMLNIDKPHDYRAGKRIRGL